MNSNTTLLQELSLVDLRELLNEQDSEFGCPIIFKAKFLFAAGFFIAALIGRGWLYPGFIGFWKNNFEHSLSQYVGK